MRALLVPGICLVLAGSLTAQTLYVPGGSLGTSSNSSVGIGTSNPANFGTDYQILDLYKNGMVSMFIARTPNVAFEIQTVDWGLVVVGTRTNHPLVFRVNEAESMRLSPGGNVGIGTTSPAARLDVSGNLLLSGARSVLLTTGDNTTTHRGGIQFLTYDNGLTNIWTPTDQGGYPRDASIRLGGFGNFNNNIVNLAVSGNVGIGTVSPSHKLAVNGTIRAKEVIVDTGWADYVFAPGYRLAPLSEVEAHIREKGHLPGIPSAAEVAGQGVSLGEMQTKLLAKLEEVTLHLIALEKELAAARRENADLRRQLSGLNLQP